MRRQTRRFPTGEIQLRCYTGARDEWIWITGARVDPHRHGRNVDVGGFGNAHVIAEHITGEISVRIECCWSDRGVCRDRCEPDVRLPGGPAIERLSEVKIDKDV